MSNTTSNTPAEKTEAKPAVRQKKWTKEYEKEYMRKYMREKWRRDHGVKPERQQERKINFIKEAEKYGEGAVKFYKFFLSIKNKKERKSTEKVVCSVCHAEHINTEGKKKMHDLTVRHRLAVELQQLSVESAAKSSADSEAKC